MEFDKSGNQIIVRRVKKVVDAHHGGAWKVAFADFATAMMAFFLVLWLLAAATPKELKAVSGYFNDPSAFSEGGSPYVIDLGGSVMDNQDTGTTKSQTPENAAQKGIVMDEKTVQDLAQEIEARKLDKLKSQLEARIQENPSLNKYKDQIIMQVTKEGLQIQIVDKESRPMFDSGSDVIKSYMNDILKALAETIRDVPNKISVTGHTDAQVFVDSKGYTNWELSADRANAARRSLEQGGVKETQVAQVVGLSSSVPYDAANPSNPINRRISILVMNQQSQKKLQAQQEGHSIEEDTSDLPVDPDFKVPAGAAKPDQSGTAAPTGEDAKQKEMEDFDRLRKTMTRKNAETAPAPSSDKKNDQFFE